MFYIWFSGLSFLLIQRERTCTAHECKMSNNSEGKSVANCSFLAIHPDALTPNITIMLELSIPEDLNENIEILDVSDYPHSVRFNGNELKRYTHLVEFHARNLSFLNLPKKFFVPAKGLKLLDVSESKLDPNSILPSSITTLKADNTKTPVLKMSSLNNLEHLHFRNNDVERFPSLSKVAPLATIDLSENSNLRVTLLNIAPYCLLKHVELSGTKIEQSDLVKECCEIASWLTDMGAKYNFTCALKAVEQCEPVSSSQAEKMYNDCVSRYQPTTSSVVELVVQTILGIALISSMIFLIFKFYRSGAVRGLRTPNSNSITPSRKKKSRVGKLNTKKNNIAKDKIQKF